MTEGSEDLRQLMEHTRNAAVDALSWWMQTHGYLKGILARIESIERHLERLENRVRDSGN